MAFPAVMSSTTSFQSNSSDNLSTCPFCEKGDFKNLENHLPSCKERNGRDNSMFLSKTLKKENPSKLKNMFSPRCY